MGILQFSQKWDALLNNIWIQEPMEIALFLAHKKSNSTIHLKPQLNRLSKVQKKSKWFSSHKLWVLPQQLRLVLQILNGTRGLDSDGSMIEPGLWGFCRSTMSELWYDLLRALDEGFGRIFVSQDPFSHHRVLHPCHIFGDLKGVKSTERFHFPT